MVQYIMVKCMVLTGMGTEFYLMRKAASMVIGKMIKLMVKLNFLIMMVTLMKETGS